jgi:AcrR family transcriptional regulator
MKKITDEEILKVASQLVEEKGMDKVTLSQVGDQLNISHAALYKHFKNKKDLWTTLALKWLDGILSELFPFEDDDNISKTQKVHDWFWILASRKKQAYLNDPDMFKLYTEYIDQNPDVLKIHLDDLYNSLSATIDYHDHQDVVSLIQAFTTFSAPSYAPTWDKDMQNNFENLWNLLQPGVEKMFQKKDA